MQVFPLGSDKGVRITQYDSRAIMKQICSTHSETRIGQMILEENGVLGFHRASVPQLLIVLSGEATVETQVESKHITLGDVVFWEKGEYHQTSSEKGFIALVIEAESLKFSSIR